MILIKTELIIVITIALTFNIKGNLMEEHSEKEYCSSEMPCVVDEVYEFYLQSTIKCPTKNPLIELLLAKSYAQIRCLLANENVYNCLDRARFYFKGATELRIYQCPILEAQAFVELKLFKHVEIRKIESLEFSGSSLGTSLTRTHFSELKGLRALDINNYNIKNIADDLFNNVSTLERLRLSYNKLHLPPGIFKNLQMLWDLDLSYNNLGKLQSGTFQNQKILEKLNLTGNALKNLTKNTFEGLESLLELDLTDNDLEVLQTDVFHNLGNLTQLNLSGNRLRVLPDQLLIKNEHLEVFILKNNSVRMEKVPDRLFNTNPRIKSITLETGLKDISSQLFVGASNITYLSLAYNNLTQLPNGLFSDQKNLIELDLSNNLLVELGNVFKDKFSLETLKLSGNQLKNISRTSFRSLHQLKEVYMNDNNLNFIDKYALDSVYLEIIDLANNHLTTFMSTNIFTTSLRVLNLKNNSLTTVVSSWYNSKNKLWHLNELDLSFNAITTFSSYELSYLFDTTNVNLTNNQITEIDLNNFPKGRNDPSFLEGGNDLSKINVYIENNPINCDCNISTLVKYLDKQSKGLHKIIRLEPGRLKCSKPQNLVHREVRALTLNELLCPWNPLSSICPEPCKCYVPPIDDAAVPITVNCSNLNLKKIPDLSVIESINVIELNISNNNITELLSANTTGNPKVRKIYASNNLIVNLGVENLPNNITILEIDNNKLSYLNPTTISKLYNITSLQNLSLSGNSWRCDCESIEFLSFIQNRYNLISDYELIKCENGKSIRALSQTDFCPQYQVILIAVCVAIALFGLISGIVVGLYYKFNQEIKVWLFAHNLCLWFVTEEKLDQDKKYDAFISFSHKDEDFVLKHLIPNLENIPNPYKLCIHHRDWNAGEFIQKQILKSIQESRKTIVVLSPNFMESYWGRLEFVIANTTALKDGRVRVIVIMYEDIGNMSNLDSELRTYISMNTYLKWGDPRFWEKLRFALPHPPKNKKPKKGLKNTNFERSVDENIELTIPSTSTALANNSTNFNSSREVPVY